MLSLRVPRIRRLCSVFASSEQVRNMSRKRTIDTFFTPPAKQRKVNDADGETQGEPVRLGTPSDLSVRY